MANEHVRDQNLALLAVFAALVAGIAGCAAHRVPGSARPGAGLTNAAVPTTGQGFAGAYQEDSSGVLRIMATTCAGTGQGTGFLLPSGMIATVAHVVSGSVAVAVATPDGTTSATLVGFDPGQDLALLRPNVKVTGHAFVFAADQPRIGSQVAALGYPYDQALTLTAGTVSGLDREAVVDGVTRDNLVQTDAPINPGNSGGPLVTPTGAVVGLVDAKDTDASGIGYAVDAQVAKRALEHWQTDPRPSARGACENALRPSTSNSPNLPESAGTGVAIGIDAMLNACFRGINTGDHAAAVRPTRRATP
jgi:serine protease Do